MTRVVVTGAGGFIGALLVKQLLSKEGVSQALELLIAVDLQLDNLPDDVRVLPCVGSVADPELIERICRLRPDVIFHLASVPGGMAERNYALGRQINLDATAQWLQSAGEHCPGARFVYASSIAVYGADLPSVVDEQTPAIPSLSYGVHKRACELLVMDATRRGWVQGCSLRLPGIVARPGPAGGLLSAFMSDIFWALADGRPITLPVSEQGKAWWLSARAAVDNLLFASQLERDALAGDRVCQMPALWLSMGELVDALVARFGQDRRSLVQYAPDPLIQGLFASYPQLQTPRAERLGLRSDGTVESLVESVLAFRAGQECTLSA